MHEENQQKISPSSQAHSERRRQQTHADTHTDADVDFNEVWKKIRSVRATTWVYALLLIIVIFGFSLRLYHVDYPVVGYHNWKTAHYITEARNFAEDGFFANGFFVPARDLLNSINDHESGAHADTFPLASIVVALAFKLFGSTLTVARGTMIVFSLASIVMMYFFVRKLFGREDLAIVSALLLTINPLSVFFTHNVQLVTVGLFLVLAALYWYMKWHINMTTRSLLIWVSALTLAGLAKYPYLITFFPIALTFPYVRVWNQLRHDAKSILLPFLPFLALPLWFVYAEQYLRPTYVATTSSSHISSLVDFSIFRSTEFSTIMRSYIADNFTVLGIWFAVFGFIALLFVMVTQRKWSFPYRFLFTYVLSLAAFLPIMGYKLSGHNYHQFYVVPLIIVLMSYFVVFVANNLARIMMSLIRAPHKQIVMRVLTATFVVLIVFVIPFSSGKSLYGLSQESWERMYNTQFPGLDAAGEYIRLHSPADETVVHSSGQNYGVLWHADRQGYKNPGTPEKLQQLEEERGVSWIFMYQWGLNDYLQNEDLMSYLRINYHLVQFGFRQQGESIQPIYFLLKKGGTFNETTLAQQVQGKSQTFYEYEYVREGTVSPYTVGVVNVE